MGTATSIIYKEGTIPDVIPETGTKPTFDPQLGFDPRRKVRDPKMSRDEMKALRLDRKSWDYCAYFLKELNVCKKDNKPFYLLCKSQLHNYKECEYDDYVLRMKEFEREKRLRIRQKKIEEMNMAK